VRERQRSSWTGKALEKAVVAWIEVLSPYLPREKGLGSKRSWHNSKYCRICAGWGAEENHNSL
jgi:hypothetical protein